MRDRIRGIGPEKARVFLLAFTTVWLIMAPATVCTAADTDGPEGEHEESQVPAKPARPGSPEGFKWGVFDVASDIEIGYRWIERRGNRDVSRSMINLGSGAKLLRSHFSLTSERGAGAPFDRMDVTLHNWGGDPYRTLRVKVQRMDLYEFRLDHTNLRYYNFIPAFANPLLASGEQLGQHSLNVTYRATDMELRLFPRSRVRPYFGYTRSSGFGPGFTTLGLTGNEFLLDTRWRYSADDYRGGVELSLPRLHLTLEQGYRFLRNDTSVAREDTTTGNNPGTFLGQRVVLDSLNRGYHDRTKLPFSKVLAKFAPLANLSFTGRYVYSMADLESTLGEINQGNFVTLEDLLFYKTSADSFDTRAKRPSHSVGFVSEFAPHPRLYLRNQLETRRYHISGNAILRTTYFDFRPIASLPDDRSSLEVTRLRDSFLSYDQVRNQAEAEFELGRGFTARVGHRYTFVETALLDGEEEGARERGDFTQQTALAGFSFRKGTWLRLGLDYENNQTDNVLTRTSLLDHDVLRFDWNLRPFRQLAAGGRIAFLRNSNDRADLGYDSHHRSYTFAVSYEFGERFFVSADYSRTNILSTLAILLPHNFAPDVSLFDERSHAAGASLHFRLPRRIEVDFGYRGMYNSGNFPLNYHQPFAGLMIPLAGGMGIGARWQYYGYNEKGLSFQDHRNNLVTLSLAYRY